MSGKTVRIRYTADTSGVKRGSRQAEREVKRSTSRMSRMGAAGMGAIGGAVGGVVSSITGSLLPVLGDAVKAAADEQDQYTRLAAVIGKAVPEATGAMVTAQLDAVSAMQMTSTFADDELRPAYARLVGVTGDLTTAQALLQASMDVAAATGKPLATVTTAVAKAADGSTTALRKLLPGIDLTGIKAGDTAELVRRLSDRVGGVDKAAATTTANGKLGLLGKQFGEIAENVGKGLLDGLEDFTAWAQSPEGQKALEDMGSALGSLAEGVGKAASAFGWLADQWNKLPEDLRNALLKGAQGPFLGDWFGQNSRSAVGTYGAGDDGAVAPLAGPAPVRLAAAAAPVVVNLYGPIDPDASARAIRRMVGGHLARTGGERGRAW